MNREEFYNSILKNCDLDKELKPDERLADIEDWDSLAFIKVLSLFKQDLKMPVEVSELKECKTFDDILNLGSKYYEE